MPLTLADFDFALPPELIAQAPPERRGESRLLHVAGSARTDRRFADLPALVQPGDLLVFNDTRVIHARVFAEKSTGGRVEIMIERLTGDDRALVQLRASHAPKIGAVLRLPAGAQATVTGRDQRFFELEFTAAGGLANWLEAHGQLPLPPYIGRSANADDEARYQTVYAKTPGAVAAPTAGLHFDAAMLESIAAAGVASAWITLHVGAGTFAPVKEQDLTRHRMHSEWFAVPDATVEAVVATRARGGKVLAVGTTTLRALESAALAPGGLAAGTAQTRLFVTPGFRFRVVDRLLTNFHLPKSTLLMLVSAFAGVEAIRDAYSHAIAARYRFFSYGDAMLLERARDQGRSCLGPE